MEYELYRIIVQEPLIKSEVPTVQECAVKIDDNMSLIL